MTFLYGKNFSAIVGAFKSPLSPYFPSRLYVSKVTAATQNISDQVWTISYEIIGSYVNLAVTYNFDLITSNDELVSFNTCCCVKKMAANLKTNCCDCGDSLMNYLKAKAMLDSATASADVGEYDAAQKAIMKAADICDAGCTSC